MGGRSIGVRRDRTARCSLVIGVITASDEPACSGVPTGHLVGDPDSAGINRHVVGDARALQEGSSESILALSLARDIARCLVRRRPDLPVGGAIELRKADGSGCRLTPFREGGRQHRVVVSILRSLRTRAR